MKQIFRLAPLVLLFSITQGYSCPEGQIDIGDETEGRKECVEIQLHAQSSSGEACVEGDNFSRGYGNLFFDKFFRSSSSTACKKNKKQLNDVIAFSEGHSETLPDLDIKVGSDVAKCHFDLYGDEWAKGNDSSLRRLELTLLGFESAYNLEGAITKDYWSDSTNGKSLNERSRNVAKKLYESRKQKQTTADEYNKELTCKCVASWGGEAAANLEQSKRDFFKSNCPDEIKIVQENMDQNNGRFSDASGKIRIKLLNDFNRMKMEYETINTASIQNIITELKTLNQFSQNIALWNESVQDEMKLPNKGDQTQIISADEGKRYYLIDYYRVRDSGFMGMSFSHHGREEIESADAEDIMLDHNWNGGVVSNNIWAMARYMTTPFSARCGSFNASTLQGNPSSWNVDYSKKWELSESIKSNSCPNGNCGLGINSHAGHCIKKAYKYTEAGDTYYLLDPIISHDGSHDQPNLISTYNTKFKCKLEEARKYLSLRIDALLLITFRDKYKSTRTFLSKKFKLLGGTKIYTNGNHSCGEEAEKVVKTKVPTISSSGFNKVKLKIKDYLQDKSLFKNASEEDADKMVDYVFKYHYILPKKTVAGQLTYPTPGILFYYEKIYLTAKAAEDEYELRNELRQGDLSGSGYGGFGDEMVDGGTVYNENSLKVDKHKNEGISIDIKNNPLSAIAQSNDGKVQSKSEKGFTGARSALSKGIFAIQKRKADKKVELAKWERKIGNKAISNSILKKSKGYLKSMNDRFKSQNGSGRASVNSAIGKVASKVKGNNINKQTIITKNKGATHNATSSFSSRYGEESDEIGSQRDYQNEHLINQVERNKHKFKSAESDTIFQRVSKAYLRNAELVLSKKKKSSGTKKVDPKKKKELEHFFN